MVGSPGSRTNLTTAGSPPHALGATWRSERTPWRDPRPTTIFVLPLIFFPFSFKGWRLTRGFPPPLFAGPGQSLSLPAHL